MDIHSEIQKNIMMRVRFIARVRRFVQSISLKLVVAVGLVVFQTIFISFRNVFSNMPTFDRPSELYNFTLSAFINTELIVKVLILGFALALIFVARDLLRKLRVGSPVTVTVQS